MNLNADKVSQLFDSTSMIVTNAVSQVLATSSRLFIAPHRSSGFSDRTSIALLVSYVALAGASSVLLVQLTTSANPIGVCYTFWKQLRQQVRFFAVDRTSVLRETHLVK
jgi:hypothetical protein